MYDGASFERGLTLIEVLVALAVLSLGVFSMQVAGLESMRLARASLQHSQAVLAARDLFAVQGALLRAHPELVQSVGFDLGPPSGPGEDCDPGDCSPGALQADLYNAWKCSLGYAQHCTGSDDLRRLTGFDAQMRVDAGSRLLIIEITWTTRGASREVRLNSPMP